MPEILVQPTWVSLGILIFKASWAILICTALTCSCWEVLLLKGSPQHFGVMNKLIVFTDEQDTAGRVECRIWKPASQPPRTDGKYTCTSHGRFKSSQRFGSRFNLGPHLLWRSIFNTPREGLNGRVFSTPSQPFCPGPPGDCCSIHCLNCEQLSLSKSRAPAVLTSDGTGDSSRANALSQRKRDYLSPTTCYTMEVRNANKKTKQKSQPIKSLWPHETPWSRSFCFTVYM